MFYFIFFILFSSNPIFAKSTYQVMSYNVENLFDTKHDSGKNDWTFIPSRHPEKNKHCKKIKNKWYKKSCFETNWTKEKLNKKISHLVNAIKKEGKGLPDFLALQEVENENVVKMLAIKLGFKHIQISDSLDKRGIDVALLYNQSKSIKMVSHGELVLKGGYFKKRPTRNILEVEFLIEGKYPLTIFVNHWPSLRNPDDVRAIAAAKLLNRIKKILQKNSSQSILALGDFNTIPSNRPHAFNDILLKEKIMHDTHTQFNLLSPLNRNKNPVGTYFWIKGKRWNLLDRIFHNNSLVDGQDLEINLKSYAIYNPEFLKKDFRYTEKRKKFFGEKIKGIPKKYNFLKDLGYSDHFPITVKLVTP